MCGCGTKRRGLVVVGVMVGLGELKALFQPNDSQILYRDKPSKQPEKCKPPKQHDKGNKDTGIAVCCAHLCLSQSDNSRRRNSDHRLGSHEVFIRLFICSFPIDSRQHFDGMLQIAINLTVLMSVFQERDQVLHLLLPLLSEEHIMQHHGSNLLGQEQLQLWGAVGSSSAGAARLPLVCKHGQRPMARNLHGSCKGMELGSALQCPGQPRGTGQSLEPHQQHRSAKEMLEHREQRALGAPSGEMSPTPLGWAGHPSMAGPGIHPYLIREEKNLGFIMLAPADTDMDLAGRTRAGP